MKKHLLPVVVVLLCALLLCSCIYLPAAPVKETPAAEPTAAAATEAPTQAPTAAPTEKPAEPTAEPTEAPLPTPVPPKIEFTAISNAAVEKFMQVQVGAPLTDALALLGTPAKIYGASSYLYRATAGSEVAQPASVYRFSSGGVLLELIVGQGNDLVLKKQISSPSVFKKLVGSASVANLADGVPYADALKQLGKNPYLWMEYVLPNPATGDSKYQVVIWPDSDGQFAAVVKDAIVLRSEYQPNDIVLGAAVADGSTPRVPRWLEALPKNNNKLVTSYSLFKKFLGIKINANEQTILAAFGSPTTSDDSDPNSKVLTFESANAQFSGSKTLFTFTFTNGTGSLLKAKKAVVLPLGETEIRARYAPQMLSEMKKSDIEKFMGKGFAMDQFVDADGRIIESYSFAGEMASVSALIPQGSDAAIGNDAATFDTNDEAVSLYEEYVIVLKPSTPKPSPTKTPYYTPGRTRIPIKTPFITPKPTFIFRTLPLISFRPLPTPTPVPKIK